MAGPYRKRRRAINESGHAHFLTYSCWQRWPLLEKDRACQWVVDAIDAARSSQDFDLLAFVVMPEHVHLLLLPRRRDYEMRRILAALKSPVSRRAKEHLQVTGNTEWLERLTASHGNRRVFRFWQPGGGYDKNQWNERPIRETIDYIHANPVRRGLVAGPAQWKWSSAGVYAGHTDGALAIDSVKLD